MDLLTVFVVLLVAPFCVNAVAHGLNVWSVYRALKPDQTADAKTQDIYQRLRSHTYLAILASAAYLSATLLFWFFGWFARLDRLLQASLPPVVAGLAYIGTLMLARRVLVLTPFAAYAQFVIEQRYGFNRATVRTFLLDFVKWRLANGVSFGLSAIGGLVFLGEFGPAAWPLLWLTLVAVRVLMSWCVPVLLHPLFYRFTPLPAGELRAAIEQLCCQIGFPLAGVFMIDSSRRTAQSEARCMGFGRHRRVALSDTLLDRHSAPEIAAIVAHEVAHIRYYHLARHLVALVVLYLLPCWLVSELITSEAAFAVFGFSQPSLPAALVLISLYFGVWEPILTMPIKWMLRRCEYQADAFAARVVNNPTLVMQMLERLAADNLVARHQHPLFAALHRVHPTLAQRIAALRRMPQPRG